MKATSLGSSMFLIQSLFLLFIIITIFQSSTITFAAVTTFQPQMVTNPDYDSLQINASIDFDATDQSYSALEMKVDIYNDVAASRSQFASNYYPTRDFDFKVQCKYNSGSEQSSMVSIDVSEENISIQRTMARFSFTVMYDFITIGTPSQQGAIYSNRLECTFYSPLQTPHSLTITNYSDQSNPITLTQYSVPCFTPLNPYTFPIQVEYIEENGNPSIQFFIHSIPTHIWAELASRNSNTLALYLPTPYIFASSPVYLPVTTIGLSEPTVQSINLADPIGTASSITLSNDGIWTTIQWSGTAPTGFYIKYPLEGLLGIDSTVTYCTFIGFSTSTQLNYDVELIQTNPIVIQQTSTKLINIASAVLENTNSLIYELDVQLNIHEPRKILRPLITLPFYDTIHFTSCTLPTPNVDITITFAGSFVHPKWIIDVNTDTSAVFEQGIVRIRCVGDYSPKAKDRLRSTDWTNSFYTQWELYYDSFTVPALPDIIKPLPYTTYTAVAAITTFNNMPQGDIILPENLPYGYGRYPKQGTFIDFDGTQEMIFLFIPTYSSLTLDVYITTPSHIYLYQRSPLPLDTIVQPLQAQGTRASGSPPFTMSMQRFQTTTNNITTTFNRYRLTSYGHGQQLATYCTRCVFKIPIYRYLSSPTQTISLISNDLWYIDPENNNQPVPNQQNVLVDIIANPNYLLVRDGLDIKLFRSSYSATTKIALSYIPPIQPFIRPITIVPSLPLTTYIDYYIQPIDFPTNITNTVQMSIWRDFTSSLIILRGTKLTLSIPNLTNEIFTFGTSSLIASPALPVIGTITSLNAYTIQTAISRTRTISYVSVKENIASIMKLNLNFQQTTINQYLQYENDIYQYRINTVANVNTDGNPVVVSLYNNNINTTIVTSSYNFNDFTYSIQLTLPNNTLYTLPLRQDFLSINDYPTPIIQSASELIITFYSTHINIVQDSAYVRLSYTPRISSTTYGSEIIVIDYPLQQLNNSNNNGTFIFALPNDIYTTTATFDLYYIDTTSSTIHHTETKTIPLTILPSCFTPPTSSSSTPPIDINYMERTNWNSKCNTNGLCMADNTCQCINDFSGIECEIAPTTQSQCPQCNQNNISSCPITPLDKCPCKDGWGGNYCDEPITCQTETATKKCGPHGFITTSNINNNQCNDKCSCYDPWFGDKCNICGWLCYNGGIRYLSCSQCGCTASYSGPHCECKGDDAYINFVGYSDVVDIYSKLLIDINQHKKQNNNNNSYQYPDYYPELLGAYNTIMNNLQNNFATALGIDINSFTLTVSSTNNTKYSSDFKLHILHECDQHNPNLTYDELLNKWENNVVIPFHKWKVIQQYFIVENPDIQDQSYSETPESLPPIEQRLTEEVEGNTAIHFNSSIYTVFILTFFSLSFFSYFF